MITIEELKKLNTHKTIVITEHARVRLVERNISAADIINGIDTGEIIKQYEDDKPFPSCLLLGYTMKKMPIHMVISHDGEMLHLITAYYPDPEVWEADFKIKKEVSI